MATTETSIAPSAVRKSLIENKENFVQIKTTEGETSRGKVLQVFKTAIRFQSYTPDWKGSYKHLVDSYGGGPIPALFAAAAAEDAEADWSGPDTRPEGKPAAIRIASIDTVQVIGTPIKKLRRAAT